MRLSTARTLHEAEQRASQQAQKARRQRNKELQETLKEETADWSLYAKRLEKEIIDAKRATVAELRGFYASEHLVWQEASREAAVLWKRCNELVDRRSHACAVAAAACALRRWSTLPTSCGR